MIALLLFFQLLSYSLVSAYYDDFATNTSHWGLFGPSMLTTGAVVMELPAQCKFGALAEGKGLLMTMSHQPCKAHPTLCCAKNASASSIGRLDARDATGDFYSVGSRSLEEGPAKCAKMATCHMGAVRTYRFGTFEAAVRFGHHKQGRTCAKNGLSFFSVGYVGEPIHNEITIGVDGRDAVKKLHLCYWYDATMRRHEVPIHFDPCGEFHNYTVIWRPDAIHWLVDHATVHVDRGEAAKTIPFEALSTRFVLRPHTETEYHDDIFIEYKYFKYTPH